MAYAKECICRYKMLCVLFFLSLVLIGGLYISKEFEYNCYRDVEVNKRCYSSEEIRANPELMEQPYTYGDGFACNSQWKKVYDLSKILFFVGRIASIGFGIIFMGILCLLSFDYLWRNKQKLNIKALKFLWDKEFLIRAALILGIIYLLIGILGHLD